MLCTKKNKVYNTIDTKTPIGVYQSRGRSAPLFVDACNFKEFDNKNTKILHDYMVAYYKPSLTDSWNISYVNFKKKERQRKIVEFDADKYETMKRNIEIKHMLDKATSKYSRKDHMADWDFSFEEQVVTKRYRHVWKDPFFTPAIIYNQSITKPNPPRRWPAFKDVDWVDWRQKRQKRLFQKDLKIVQKILKS